MIARFLLLALALVAPTTSAWGQTAPTAPEAAAADAPTVWYGLPAVFTDSAVPFILIGGAASKSTVVTLAGLATLVVGAPINHPVHGHAVHAVGSLALRAGALALSALMLDRFVGRDCGDSCGVVAVVAILPPIAAAIVDDTALALEPAPPPAPRLTLSPGMIPGARGPVLLLGGTF